MVSAERHDERVLSFPDNMEGSFVLSGEFIVLQWFVCMGLSALCLYLLSFDVNISQKLFTAHLLKLPALLWYMMSCMFR